MPKFLGLKQLLNRFILYPLAVVLTYLHMVVTGILRLPLAIVEVAEGFLTLVSRTVELFQGDALQAIKTWHVKTMAETASLLVQPGNPVEMRNWGRELFERVAKAHHVGPFAFKPPREVTDEDRKKFGLSAVMPTKHGNA